MKFILPSLLFCFLLSACTNFKDPSAQQFSNPTPEKLDSLCEWLNTHDHNKESNYNTIYLTSYNKLIQLKKYDSAARILDIKGRKLEQTYVPDTQYMRTTVLHLNRYQAQISKRFISALYLRLGMQQSYQNEWDSSYWYLKKAYVPKTDYYTTINVAYADLFICNYFFRKGSMDTALTYGLRSKDGFRQANNTRLEIKALNQLYYVHVFSEDYPEALKTLHLADSLGRSIQDSLSIFTTYYNKMHYYNVNPAYQLDYNKAFELEAERMYSFFNAWNPQGTEGIDEHVQMHLLYSNMLIAKNDLPLAKLHLDSAKLFLNKMNPPSSFRLDDYAYAYDLYQMKTGDADLDLEKYDAILKDLEEQEQYFSLQEHYDLFYLDALRKKDFKSAIEFKEKYEAMSDSLTNLALKAKIKEFDKKYETAKKEKTITEQKARISHSKFQITLLLFSLIGLGLGSFTYFVYRKRKEAQLETLRQQKFTDELLQNTEDERKRIATDLHDGVNHELLTLKNQANHGKLASAAEIEKVINEVRQVSRDLYPAMFDNIGLAASIEALCERMTESGLFTTCAIDYTIKLSKRNELQLYRIIQEALNNTLKHAKANAAKVTIATADNELHVEIKDNGVGFSADDQINNPSSFGIQSIIQRARAMGGRSSIESNNQGTKLILNTPLH